MSQLHLPLFAAAEQPSAQPEPAAHGTASPQREGQKAARQKATGPAFGSPSAFLVTPWQTDFLHSVLGQALEECEGDLSRAVFIFPHGRPEKYLTRLMQFHPHLKKPLILPRCYTVSELFAALRQAATSRPAWNAGLLDRVGLLLDCVRQEIPDALLFHVPSVENHLSDDARHFFPWGVRLAALFEECLSQGRAPANFQYTEGQVTPFAAHLLERLSAVFARYTQGLAAREWTTPGYDAALVAEDLKHNEALPGRFFAGRRIFIAGFHALTGTENALFRSLWQKEDARVLLHADPALLEGKEHWSCSLLREWAAQWQARLEASPAVPFPPARQGQPDKNERLFPQNIRYYQGFDLHSQLIELKRELEAAQAGRDSEATHLGHGSENAAPPDHPEPAETRSPRLSSAPVPGYPSHAAETAVVLPDSGLLMPCLHHLPHTDINVSMGYPLSRSPLFRLIDTILRLQEGRRGKGYYWRDLVELIRHPYLKLLTVTPDAPNAASRRNDGLQSGHTNKPGIAPGMIPLAAEGAPQGGGPGSTSADISLRRELRRFEQTLRKSGRNYPEPRAVLEATLFSLPSEESPAPEILTLLDAVLSTTTTAFEHPATPKAVGKALDGLCSLLLTHGRHLWDRFLIDAECLYRLMQSLIPELSHSALAAEAFAPATLFAMVRRLMEAERVPFEATPLVGLQVMGVLETRLLTFKRVFLVDAGEDKLPGTPVGDPLLPEALRPELGLPGLHTREQVAAYHFFRLIAGADEVVLLWQEGADAPGIQERKKKKSRFVEELLWEEEKRLGRLLSPQGQDGPLQVLASGIAPMSKNRAGVTMTPVIQDLVTALLRRPLSASFLDSYLRCPLQFFYERVVRLAPADEPTEGDDPLALGRLFHAALQDYYAPLLGVPLPAGADLVPEIFEQKHRELLNALQGRPEYKELSKTLPADSAAMLTAAGQERLRRFLKNQPATTVIALETVLSAPFTVGQYSLTLTGTADRLDLRPARSDTSSSFASPSSSALNETHRVLHILDYKTGRLPQVSPSLWVDTGLWQRIELWQPDHSHLQGTLSGTTGTSRPPLLQELSRRLGSVQLPFYLLLYALARKENTLPEHLRSAARFAATDAAWVDLGSTGEEAPLFKAILTEEERLDIVMKRLAGLPTFLVRHMTESPCFLPQPGPYCDWCFSAKMCMFGSVLK